MFTLQPRIKLNIHVFIFISFCILRIWITVRLLWNSPEQKHVNIFIFHTDYPKGALIRRVTACKYKAFEVESDGFNTWGSLCPESMMLCPKQEPEYSAPISLTRRGLQVCILTSIYMYCLALSISISVQCWKILNNSKRSEQSIVMNNKIRYYMHLGQRHNSAVVSVHLLFLP